MRGSELGSRSNRARESAQRGPRSVERRPRSSNCSPPNSASLRRPCSRRPMPIADAVDAIARRLARGGALHYVGAGSSGRLAVLDAAEMHADVRNAPGARARAHRRRRVRAGKLGRGRRGRRRRRCGADRRMRECRRCGRRDLRQRRRGVRRSRRHVGSRARRIYARNYERLRVVARTSGADRHRVGYGPRSTDGIDANEGRDGAEDRAKYAFHGGDGAAGKGSREFDGRSGRDRMRSCATARCE